MAGMKFETLQANMLPNWSSAAARGAMRSASRRARSEGYTFGTVMATFFPCFTGILSGANRADVRRPCGGSCWQRLGTAERRRPRRLGAKNASVDGGRFERAAAAAAAHLPTAPVVLKAWSKARP